MINVKELWKKRFDETRQEISSYARLMFNDHFMIVILFMLIAGAYLYQQSLDKMSPSFPSSIVIAVILGLVMVITPIYTMLKEPDLVFRWPQSHHMQPYFNRTLLVVSSIQSFIVIVVSFMLLPLYLASELGSKNQFFLLLAVLLAMKIFNVYWTWVWKRVYDVTLHRIELFFRLLIHIVLLYVIIEKNFVQGMMLWGIVAVILTVSYYGMIVKKHSLKWELLIEEQKTGMLRFYKAANQFTDVQKLAMQVRPRRYMTWVLKNVPFQQPYTYLYMYTRAFLRAGDYFGMYIRLTVLAFIIASFTNQFYFLLGILIATVYLIGYQLIPLYRHYDHSMMVQLYPVKEEDKKIAYINFILMLLIIETILYSALVWIFTKSWVDAANILFFASMFSFWFAFKYIKKRID
ncbi:ABC transporter permease [Massilibacterium senegalense]|uniref:ABC transporter permease n=1 Tax=Massilibacterium senegalense TaxID=1632858 RepID=UPI000780210C|nr:ABC transporter permease [Massilibacterium senegalense]